MFLDEKLLEIGRSAELKTKQGITQAINKMINACFKSLSDSLQKHRDDKTILSNFKRVNKTWEDVAKMLENENKGFIKPERFKIFVESKEEFKHIFFN